jgi:hypothetical protein
LASKITKQSVYKSRGTSELKVISTKNRVQDGCRKANCARVLAQFGSFSKRPKQPYADPRALNLHRKPD